MKCTDNELQTLQDKEVVLTLENNVPGGKASVIGGDRYIISDEEKKDLVY